MQPAFKEFTIWIAITLCLAGIIISESSMKQTFLYLLTLSIALLAASVTVLSDSSVNRLDKENKKFIGSRRKIFNHLTFITLSFSAAGLFAPFITEESSKLNLLSFVIVLFLSVSTLLLAVCFYKMQKNSNSGIL